MPSKHALTLLHSAISDPEERTDLLAYDTVYYYYVNADPDSFNISLRKRQSFLSLAQRKSLFVARDHIAYRYEVLQESFDPLPT